MALAGSAALAAACNAIIGVQDVRLERRAPNDPREDGGDDTDPDDDGGLVVTRPNVFQAALGDKHACAKKVAGTVSCWGDDSQGQTGAGAPADGGIALVPRPVSGVEDAVDLAAGRNHSCVVRADGTVACWGYNFDGQLGNGESGDQSNVPVQVVGLTRAVMVAAGGNFSCALRATGSVLCWGGNAAGQLGTGDQNGSSTPVAVRSLSNVVSIAAGQAHACAVRSDGSVACWGDGNNGQLGTGTSRTSLLPVTVDNLPAMAALALSDRSTCALSQTGSVFCWGANELGQLGSGAANPNPNPAPITVVNLDDATALAGGRNHTCASRAGGSVVCWGAGASGQIGDGTFRTDAGGAQPAIVTVTFVSSASGVGAGGAHSCATTSGDAVFCWGANDRGQLGSGSVSASASPVAVIGYP